MNICLDIGSTLITKDGIPALFLEEFLEYVTAEHNCFSHTKVLIPGFQKPSKIYTNASRVIKSQRRGRIVNIANMLRK